MLESGSGAGDAGQLLQGGLDETESALSVAGFAALWAHSAQRPDELLPGVPGATRAAQSLLERGRAELDNDGRLVGVHGLSLRTTRHRFVHEGRAHQTWCAFDSIGIPAALGLDAEAHTDCPACGQRLTVRTRRGEPEADGAPMLWLPHPPAGHLISEFCSCADLYCSTEHLRLRLDPAKGAGAAMNVDAAAALGRETWSDVRQLGLTGRGS